MSPKRVSDAPIYQQRVYVCNYLPNDSLVSEPEVPSLSPPTVGHLGWLLPCKHIDQSRCVSERDSVFVCVMPQPQHIDL